MVGDSFLNSQSNNVLIQMYFSVFRKYLGPYYFLVPSIVIHFYIIFVNKIHLSECRIEIYFQNLQKDGTCSNDVHSSEKTPALDRFLLFTSPSLSLNYWCEVCFLGHLMTSLTILVKGGGPQAPPYIKSRCLPPYGLNDAS